MSMYFIKNFARGILSDEEVIKNFSKVIADGSVWEMRTFYRQSAQDFIDYGYLSIKGEILLHLSDYEPKTYNTTPIIDEISRKKVMKEWEKFFIEYLMSIKREKYKEIGKDTQNIRKLSCMILDKFDDESHVETETSEEYKTRISTWLKNNFFEYQNDYIKEVFLKHLNVIKDNVAKEEKKVLIEGWWRSWTEYLIQERDEEYGY